MQLWLVSGHFLKFERADLYSFAVSQNQINLTNRLKKTIFDVSEKFRSHTYHIYVTPIMWIQPIKSKNFMNIANIKNKDHISPARSSRFLRKFFRKTKQQAWNNRAYLFRMPWEWWNNSDASGQNYIDDTDGSLCREVLISGKKYRIYVFNAFLETFYVLFLYTEYQRYTWEIISITYLIRGSDFRAWHKILEVSKLASKLEKKGWWKPINQNCRLGFLSGNLQYLNSLTK